MEDADLAAMRAATTSLSESETRATALLVRLTETDYIGLPGMDEVVADLDKELAGISAASKVLADTLAASEQPDKLPRMISMLQHVSAGLAELGHKFRHEEILPDEQDYIAKEIILYGQGVECVQKDLAPAGQAFPGGGNAAHPQGAATGVLRG